MRQILLKIACSSKNMVLKGAEATLEINDQVIKKRESKIYRHEDLDRKIRKERTRKEARIMKEARKNNVSVPEITKKNENTLEIEKIEGEQLRDVLEKSLDSMEEMGKNAAKLHEAGIIHGDLTTRNAILGEELYLIDFGLSSRSERIEDMAVDIHLLKQVLESSHPEIAEEAWQKFVEGYQSWGNSSEVLDRHKEVEERGRYK